MKIMFATTKTWNIEHACEFKKRHPRDKVYIITNRQRFTTEHVRNINPQIIFFPHWSWIIPADVYENFSCVVFHMTDLPFGRGGSPLQNLIVRGYKKTKISALKVTGGIDAGPIYLKRNLSLEGNADQILQRASNIIFNKMVPFILGHELQPREQVGRAVVFRRRKPEDGNIENLSSLSAVCDYIRMLDGEGYPRAFINHNSLNFQLSKASLEHDKITATVEIRIGKNE